MGKQDSTRIDIQLATAGVQKLRCFENWAGENEAHWQHAS